jgi:hypothetical protein
MLAVLEEGATGLRAARSHQNSGFDRPPDDLEPRRVSPRTYPAIFAASVNAMRAGTPSAAAAFRPGPSRRRNARTSGFLA